MGQQGFDLPGRSGPLVSGQRPKAGTTVHPRRPRHRASRAVPLYLVSHPGRWRVAPFLSEPASTRETRQSGVGGGDAQAAAHAQRGGPSGNTLGTENRVNRPAPKRRKTLDIQHGYLGIPPKKAHAASSPAMTSSNCWLCMGHTKQCREWHSTTTMAHTAWCRPVAGSVIMPSLPKSASATSPGGVSSIRTVVFLSRRQLRFKMKRRSDGYDTTHPRTASNSWMRVICNRSPVSHW